MFEDVAHFMENRDASFDGVGDLTVGADRFSGQPVNRIRDLDPLQIVGEPLLIAFGAAHGIRLCKIGEMRNEYCETEIKERKASLDPIPHILFRIPLGNGTSDVDALHSLPPLGYSLPSGETKRCLKIRVTV